MSNKTADRYSLSVCVVHSLFLSAIEYNYTLTHLAESLVPDKLSSCLTHFNHVSEACEELMELNSHSALRSVINLLSSFQLHLLAAECANKPLVQTEFITDFSSLKQ